MDEVAGLGSQAQFNPKGKGQNLNNYKRNSYFLDLPTIEAKYCGFELRRLPTCVCVEDEEIHRSCGCPKDPIIYTYSVISPPSFFLLTKHINAIAINSLRISRN